MIKYDLIIFDVDGTLVSDYNSDELLFQVEQFQQYDELYYEAIQAMNCEYREIFGTVKISSEAVEAISRQIE